MFLFIKAIHIIAVISWMAGMLYLPRLYVYHSEGLASGRRVDTFEIMERRLIRAIMNPAMVVVWASGISLAYIGDLWWEIWFAVKFGAVLLMSVVHGFLSHERKALVGAVSSRSPRFYRIINEVPTVLMIVIVFMVVLKPF